MVSLTGLVCFHGMRLWLLFDLERHNPLPMLYRLVQLLLKLKIEYVHTYVYLNFFPIFQCWGINKSQIVYTFVMNESKCQW